MGLLFVTESLSNLSQTVLTGTQAIQTTFQGHVTSCDACASGGKKTSTSPSQSIMKRTRVILNSSWETLDISLDHKLDAVLKGDIITIVRQIGFQCNCKTFRLLLQDLSGCLPLTPNHVSIIHYTVIHCHLNPDSFMVGNR